ncbi:MAG: signal peptidase I [Cytophagaceae bacterium]
MKLKFWEKSDKPKAKKSQSKEWTDAILFAVIAATLIRWAFIEAFTIPTPSMERSLLVGDYLFVSKFHYGTRTPKTPLQLPLTHQTIWFTNIPSYLDWIQLPQYRLPGFTSVKNNDVVVFNYPPEKPFPTDLKTNYIKRCIAVAGDSIEVRETQVYLNGKIAENPPELQMQYLIETEGRLLFTKLMPILRKYNVTDYHVTPYGYAIHVMPETASAMEKETYIRKVRLLDRKPGEGDAAVFPHNSKFMWNQDNFGPLYIPAKGKSIRMTPENVILYGQTIAEYEHLNNVRILDDQLVIDGQVVDEYTFRQDYYFMMGDNRHNSLDSRFWGFVPEDHVVGKALLLWLSVDPNPESWYQKVRWNRLLNFIK